MGQGSSRGILVGLVCSLPLAFGTACGGVSYSVRDRSAESFPRATIVESDGETATVIPGGEYAAGKLRRLFVGEHYRDLWTTPVRVPVLNLTTFAGGLTPTRQGGDRQTLSLRFQARDGRKFVFRSVAKNHQNLLPEALRATSIADIIQDQVSAMNPAGALVVDELAHAIGVYHAHPLLVLAPDDERLGEFRQAFAGRLGFLEDYPVAGGAGSPHTAGADRIVNTRQLLKKLAKNSEDRVDSRQYLTARLLDMLVGDWDRHAGQWRWARHREDGRDRYSALPRDRDQAFVRLDGLFPRIAELSSAQMEHFSEDLEDIPSLMFLGRDLDRRLLADLDKAAWDDVAAAVVVRLSDEVIDRAARRLPGPYYELRGAWLAAALKSRRDALQGGSRSYYAALARTVAVHLSDEPEHVVVRSRDDGCVSVTVYRRGKGSGGLKGEPVYARTFFAGETDEVRVYLHGGDDTTVAEGSGSPGLVVRVLEGPGPDAFIDGSSAPASRAEGVGSGASCMTYPLPNPPPLGAGVRNKAQACSPHPSGGRSGGGRRCRLSKMHHSWPSEVETLQFARLMNILFLSRAPRPQDYRGFCPEARS